METISNNIYMLKISFKHVLTQKFDQKIDFQKWGKTRVGRVNNFSKNHISGFFEVDNSVMVTSESWESLLYL